jgi:hypothetical protein
MPRAMLGHGRYVEVVPQQGTIDQFGQPLGWLSVRVVVKRRTVRRASSGSRPWDYSVLAADPGGRTAVARPTATYRSIPGPARHYDSASITTEADRVDQRASERPRLVAEANRTRVLHPTLMAQHIQGTLDAERARRTQGVSEATPQPLRRSWRRASVSTERTRSVSERPCHALHAMSVSRSSLARFEEPNDPDADEVCSQDSRASLLRWRLAVRPLSAAAAVRQWHEGR